MIYRDFIWGIVEVRMLRKRLVLFFFFVILKSYGLIEKYWYDFIKYMSIK